NPGAQDIQGLSVVAAVAAPALSVRIVPASLAGMLAATVAFSLGHRPPRQDGDAGGDRASGVVDPGEPIDLRKAVIPLVPVALLLLAHAGWGRLAWLLRVPEAGRPDLAAALPVVRAMLIGCTLAAATAWRDLPRVVRGLFEGMGAAYRDIISLTI